MTSEEFLVWAQPFPEPLFLVTGEGTILAANAPAGTLTGLNSPTLAGKSLFNLVITSPTQLAAYLRACSRTRRMLLGGLTFRGRDGGNIECRAEGAILRPRTAQDASILLLRCRPKPQTVQPFVRLNERLVSLSKVHLQLQRTYAALQEQREWFEQTLISVGDAVIATDAQGSVTMMNTVANTLTGWTQQEALGRQISDVFHIVNMETRQVVEDPVSRVLREGTIVGLANHTLLISRDGSERLIDDSGAPISAPDGRLIGVVLVFRDVTERLQAERALQQSHAELERRVAERTEALRQEMAERQRLERETQRLQHFVLLGRLAAGVSHEIRNPLGAVFLQVDILDEELQAFLPERPPQIAEVFTEIKMQLARLEDLVEDYLSMVRVATIERTLQDLGAAVQAWAMEWQDLAASQRITFHLQGIVDVGWAAFHASTLRRALLNLVQNALEAMSQEGTLTLAGQRTPSAVYLTVRDTGSGIPAERLAQIFEPLYTTKPGGTGLGLYIAQEIVAAHGGQLHVQSTVGQGTTFTMTLPLTGSKAAT